MFEELASKARMVAKLKAEARGLTAVHGQLMARHFTINPDRGLVSDIRDGSLFAYLSLEYAEMENSYLTSWAPWNLRDFTAEVL